MSKLFVITYKRPAAPIEKELYGVEDVYDCESVTDEYVSSLRLKKAQERYENVEMFECEADQYVAFMKMPDAVEHFTKTGEHSMKSIEEEIEADVESEEVHMHLNVTMERKSPEYSFEYYPPEIDNGQIVFTPKDKTNNVAFTDANWAKEDDGFEELETDKQKKFRLCIRAHMLSDIDNFKRFYDISPIGQLVICPEEEETSFLTASVDDSLNLTTDNNESVTLVEGMDPSSDEYSRAREACVELIDALDASLEESLENATKIKELFNRIGIEYRDVDEMLNKLEKFREDREGEVSVTEFIRRIETFEQGESVEESLEVFNEELELTEELSEEEKLSVIDRFMKGDVTILQADAVPEVDTIVRLADLDSNDSSGSSQYYYDTAADVVICHTRWNKQ